MHWAEAKQQYTLDVYSRMHPVNLPTTYFWLLLKPGVHTGLIVRGFRKAPGQCVCAFLLVKPSRTSPAAF
jgi:hypothetical protein